ncbi:hypothetical protein RAJCM14343_4624 [Rhodococcus aetherivorans]|uniref:Uncharacterized protein n=1 Tax=Rhodococcus aetherivorans TaxID=191292 RepID=A0ABQ0YS15_9NOCA|nr:hypothetical protein RAJCM14343_4624 [Rhodococcus aetherivorans]
MVAARELHTRQIELTGHAGRHRIQPRIQHVNLRIPLRQTDRDGPGVGQLRLPVGDRDGGLGGTVEVVQPGGGDAGEGVRGLGGQGLTDDEHVAQRHQVLRVGVRDEDREHRRHEVGEGHAVPGDGPCDVFGVAVPVGRRDDQRGTGPQRKEEPPERHVEGGRGLLQIHVGRGEPVFVLHPGHLVGDRAVRHRDTLGPARRAGGEDDVGGVLGAELRGAFGGGDRGRGECRELDGVEMHDREGGGKRHRVPLGGQHAHRCRGLEDVLRARRGMVRVHGHVRATGTQHGVHANDELDRAAHGQGHPGLRPDAERQQMARKPIDACVELGVGESLALVHQRRLVRRAVDPGVEAVEQKVVRDGMRRGVADGGQVAALRGVEHVDVADRNDGILRHRVEHPEQPFRDRRHGRFVEQGGRVGEHADHARILGVASQRQLQVEARGGHVDAHAGDPETFEVQVRLLDVLEEQGDLEQRVPGLRTRRVEHLDEALERQVGVGEGTEIGLPGVLQQLGERGVRGHLGAQHEGVDEHADEIVERLFPAAGHGGADRDVVGSRQSRK